MARIQTIDEFYNDVLVVHARAIEMLRREINRTNELEVVSSGLVKVVLETARNNQLTANLYLTMPSQVNRKSVTYDLLVNEGDTQMHFGGVVSIPEGNVVDGRLYFPSSVVVRKKRSFFPPTTISKSLPDRYRQPLSL